MSTSTCTFRPPASRGARARPQRRRRFPIAVESPAVLTPPLFTFFAGKARSRALKHDPFPTRGRASASQGIVVHVQALGPPQGARRGGRARHVVCPR